MTVANYTQMAVNIVKTSINGSKIIAPKPDPKRVGNYLLELALRDAGYYEPRKGNFLATDYDGKSYEIVEVHNKCTNTFNDEAFEFSSDQFVAALIDASNILMYGLLLKVDDDGNVEEIPR